MHRNMTLVDPRAKDEHEKSKNKATKRVYQGGIEHREQTKTGSISEAKWF